MNAVKGRVVDGELQIHVKIDVVEEEFQGPLILLIAAGRAEDHPRLAVFEHQTRRQGRSRAFAGNQGAGVVRVEIEHLAARAHREAESRDDR